MVRSLNNLDERFHHSYFLYLLTGPESFVTVEIYIVPLVALIAALMVKVCASALHAQAVSFSVSRPDRRAYGRRSTACAC